MISQTQFLPREKDCSFELMHCVSTYPMKVEEVNLITIDALEKFKCDDTDMKMV